jgi:hypothetical protein
MTATLRDATRSERVRSALATAGATAVLAVAAAFVVGLVLFVWGLVTGDPLARALPVATAPGSFGPDYQSFWREMAGAGPAWVGPVSLLLVLVIAWLGSCRIGRGTPGDAIMSLTAHDADGRRPARWRAMLRTGMPLALLGVGVALGSVWLGLALATVPWLPALVRADRRSAYDLASGIRVATTAPVKGDFEWKVRSGRDSSG